MNENTAVVRLLSMIDHQNKGLKIGVSQAEAQRFIREVMELGAQRERDAERLTRAG